MNFQSVSIPSMIFKLSLLTIYYLARNLTPDNDHQQSRNENLHEAVPYGHLYVPEPNIIFKFRRKRKHLYGEQICSHHTYDFKKTPLRIKVILNLTG